MQDLAAYVQGLMDQKSTFMLSGIVVVMAFQLSVFRFTGRSNLQQGPSQALIAAPDRVFGIFDREVVWMLISYLVTILSIAWTGSPRQRNSAAAK